jgi:hypothetical protein
LKLVQKENLIVKDYLDGTTEAANVASRMTPVTTKPPTGLHPEGGLYWRSGLGGGAYQA